MGFQHSLTMISVLTTAYFTIFDYAKPSTMRTFLQHTSASRPLNLQTVRNSHTAHTSYGGYTTPEQVSFICTEPTSAWLEGSSKEEFTLGAERWTRNVQPHGSGDDEAGTTASYAPVSDAHAYLVYRELSVAWSCFIAWRAPGPCRK